jgi:tRNA(fMet)-specific endonuclease VapC
MNGDYLLDSNIVIDLFKGDSKVISRIKQLKEIKIPVIVIGELYFGANKSNQTPKRLQEVEQLENLATILDVTNSTARIYGEIKDQLRLKGKPIPENDIWIAAITKEHHLTLLTKDRHFESVDGISIEMF